MWCFYGFVPSAMRFVGFAAAHLHDHLCATVLRPNQRLLSLLLSFLSAILPLSIPTALLSKPKCCCLKSLKGKRQNGERAKLQGWTKLPIYMTYGSARINGDFFERALSSKAGNTHAAVLFYASWCPFSWDVYSTFEVLGSMYPQIDHLTVEQSSAMPSLFSRYGIHSLPAVLILNHNSRTLFGGSKDLDTLIKFYKKTTGHKPVRYIAVDQYGSLGRRGKPILLPEIGSSAKEILTRDPSLLFSLLFLCSHVVIILFSKVLFHSKTLMASFRPQLNLEIFGETGQILGRIFHVIDFQRVWTKIRLCKHRNFHRGVRNARAFASSLASVSLNETSTPKL